MDATEFVYDIDFCLAEPEACIGHQSPERKTLRVTVVDPNPQPGCGPALGTIHKALRDRLHETDPEAWEQMRSSDDLVILKLRAADA
ncbi:hypothetical protein ACFVX9_17820 [Kitasatospora sp. NPDC058243]|uniref:hypothetical protein n=1 Tax=Kitasatospora sp. NPDC058243 TaxID=3346397 RepID=UPI0036DA5091